MSPLRLTVLIEYIQETITEPPQEEEGYGEGVNPLAFGHLGVVNLFGWHVGR
jgi:hypothetical protein